ncbi:MAG TPA: hypothetical protein VGN37_23860 [Actinocatenispora sp.]
MGMELPEWLGWLHWVVGTDWPEGDEDAMRRMADAWRGLGTAVGTAGSDGDAAVGRILTALDSADGVRFDRAWSAYAGGGEAYMTELTEACGALAKLCEGTAEEIEYAKYTFLVMLIILAIDIIVMLALAVETLGATLAEIVGEEAITQLAIREIAGQVVERIAARAVEKAAATGVRELALGAAKEFGKGVAPDLVAQTAMLADGHENGGWNFARTGQAVGGAAVDAAAGFGADRFGETGLGSRVFPDTLFGQSVKGAATGAVSGAASPLFGGELPAWQDAAQGATSGAFGGAVGYGRETVEQYRWSTPGGEHVAVPDAGTDLAAATPSTSDRPVAADAEAGPDLRSTVGTHSPEPAANAHAVRSPDDGEVAAPAPGRARGDAGDARRTAGGDAVRSSAGARTSDGALTHAIGGDDRGRAAVDGSAVREGRTSPATAAAPEGRANVGTEASRPDRATAETQHNRATGETRHDRATGETRHDPPSVETSHARVADTTRHDREGDAAGRTRDAGRAHGTDGDTRGGRASGVTEEARGDRNGGGATDEARGVRAGGAADESRSGRPDDRAGEEHGASARTGPGDSGRAPHDGAGQRADGTAPRGTAERAGTGDNAAVAAGSGGRRPDEPGGVAPGSERRAPWRPRPTEAEEVRYRTDLPTPDRPLPQALPAERPAHGSDGLGYDPHRPGFPEPPHGVDTVHHNGHEWVRLDDGAGWHRVDFRATDPRCAGKGFAARLRTFMHRYFPPRDGHTSEDLFKDARSKVDTEVPEGREWEFERLTESEAQALAGIRGESRLLVPGDTEGTHRVSQKIVPGGDIERYVKGRYTTVTGFVTKLVDVVHLRSPSAIIRALRLDYEKTGFRFQQDDVFAIRMTLTEHAASDRVAIPSSPRLAANSRPDGAGPSRRAVSIEAPFSGSGFSAEYTDGAPELKAANPEDQRGGIPLRNGAEMWRIGRDGHEVLYAVYHFGRWHGPT